MSQFPRMSWFPEGLAISARAVQKNGPHSPFHQSLSVPCSTEQSETWADLDGSSLLCLLDCPLYSNIYILSFWGNWLKCFENLTPSPESLGLSTECYDDTLVLCSGMQHELNESEIHMNVLKFSRYSIELIQVPITPNQHESASAASWNSKKQY